MTRPLRSLLSLGLLWLPGTALGLLLALALLTVWWSGTEGSLEQALRWAQAASERHPDTLGRLRVSTDDHHSQRLRDGGRVPALHWSSQGLTQSCCWP